MKYYLVRHAKTDATRKNRHEFGPQGAPINQAGIESSNLLKQTLQQDKVDFTQDVATSELIRTQQTALSAGFENIVINKLLNEVNTGNIEETERLVSERKVPEKAIEAARVLLKNPPKQSYWFTHGLLIAAVLDELGYKDRKDYILGFSELFEIEIK